MQNSLSTSYIERHIDHRIVISLDISLSLKVYCFVIIRRVVFRGIRGMLGAMYSCPDIAWGSLGGGVGHVIVPLG